MNITENDVLVSKVTGKAVKVLAVVKDSPNKDFHKIVVVDAKLDSKGRASKISGTERILLADSIRRRYI